MEQHQQITFARKGACLSIVGASFIAYNEPNAPAYNGAIQPGSAAACNDKAAIDPPQRLGP